MRKLNLIGSALAALVLAMAGMAGAQEAEKESLWADFIERDFPFFCHVLDARRIGGEWPEEVTRNLTPRGIIMNLGNGYWACFDPDLLRISLVWQEEDGKPPITEVGMAPGSYHEAGRKAVAGQEKLPEPVGEPVLANGIYPGWYVGKEFPENLTDPRPAPPDPNEVGRGPVNPEVMRWEGIEVRGDGMALRYRVGNAEIEEIWHWGEEGLQRVLTVQPQGEPLVIVHGFTPEGELLETAIPASDKPQKIEVTVLPGKGKKPVASASDKVIDPAVTVKGTGGALAEAEQPYVIDRVPLPTENPWKRNVRLSGLDFFSDGRAALCTFDGDVWIAEGISGDLQNVTWRRFAAGLNEAMALQIVDEEIYVYDRTCIWKLNDEDGDGTCDLYENFCNVMGQTAETREFPNDMVKIPGGGFFIAKPGQLETTRGLHNGHILKVSADGRSVETVARGFRQPYIGFDAENKLLTASDQQGNWVPATPIHVVKKDDWYGYLPDFVKEQSEMVVEPPLWIPHFVNQSGASQITNHDKRWGPLADDLIHIGFNRPELFRVYLDEGQGAISSTLTGFGTGTLKAAVNPADGQLYVCGFRIWGTIADDLTGFYRVRYTGKGVLETPEDVRSEERGVLMRFEFPVDEAIASSLMSYEVDRWNYLRSSAYGSGHYTLDGEPGLEPMPVASAYVSEDKRAVFIGLPDMKPVDQMRVTYRLPVASDLPQIRTAFLTVRELRSIDLEEEGFGKFDVNLTPPAPIPGQEKKASVEEGERLYVAAGCAGCHSIDGSQAEKPGPTLLGLFNSKREFIDGGVIRNADEVYLRESILDPARRTVKGFKGDDVFMPSYLGILQDYQVDSLILYIKSLKKASSG